MEEQGEIFPPGTTTTPQKLPSWMESELRVAGGTNDDLRVLGLVPEELRVPLQKFFVSYRKRGTGVLRVFEELARTALSRGWPVDLGSITLAGWARGTVEGFTCDNGAAVFYVVALRLSRPDLAEFLDTSSARAAWLLRLNWRPDATE